MEYSGDNGGRSGNKRSVIDLYLQKIPQRNDEFRQRKQNAELQKSAFKTEITPSAEKDRHYQHQQSGDNKSCNIVIYLIQQRILTSDRPEHEFGQNGNSIAQYKKGQRNKQCGK